MTVIELLQHKQRLEKTIRNAIEDFEAETGMLPSSISYDVFETVEHGKQSPTVVFNGVRVSLTL